MIEHKGSEKIYRTKFPGDCKELVNKVRSKLDEIFPIERDEGITPARAGGACTFHNFGETGRNLNEWKEFSEFMDFINPHYIQYLHELNLDYNNMEFVAMWACRYPTGAYAWRHRHTEKNDLIDILFYVQLPNNGGDLYIEEPNGEPHKIELTEGDIVIFPTGLFHWTDPNQSTVDRLMIGIEYKVKNVE